MKLEAVYDRGRLEFTRPVLFKRDRVHMNVEVPDSEILHPPGQDPFPQALVDQARAMLDRLDAIRNAPLPPEDQVPEWNSSRLERMEAFDLRARMREEQGRPA